MKTSTLLAVIILFLVLLATTAGVFYQTPGAPFEYVTIRGERVMFQGTGLYHYDPAWFAQQGIIWDAINLFIGLPLLAIAIYLSHRNSLRGQLLLSGLLFYFFYVYLMAMAGNSFNPLFLVYVAIFALSMVTLFINLYAMDVEHLPSQFSSRFPRRLFIGFVFVAGGVLVLLWVGRLIPIIVTNQFPPVWVGVTTLVTQGIDLGFVVPLLLSTGILLWRRSPWGYLLTSLSLSYGLMMFITLPAFAIVSVIQDGKNSLIEAVPFLSLSLVGLVMTVVFYRNVQAGENLPTPMLVAPHGARN